MYHGCQKFSLKTKKMKRDPFTNVYWSLEWISGNLRTAERVSERETYEGTFDATALHKLEVFHLLYYKLQYVKRIG